MAVGDVTFQAAFLVLVEAFGANTDVATLDECLWALTVSLFRNGEGA